MKLKPRLLKKAGTIAISAVLVGSLLGSTVFAAQTAKILVNGVEVVTNVSPQIINGRVMVPISFVARALGADVDWNGKTKTVNIKTQNSSSGDDIMVQQIPLQSIQSYINARNTIISFLNKYDMRDQTGRELVSEDFDSDIFLLAEGVVIPIGGIFPQFLDYKIIDAKQDSNKWIIRLEIYEYDPHSLQVNLKLVDFHVTDNKISEAWLAGDIRQLDDYTVFPGLTVNK